MEIAEAGGNQGGSGQIKEGEDEGGDAQAIENEHAWSSFGKSIWRRLAAALALWPSKEGWGEGGKGEGWVELVNTMRSLETLARVGGGV